MTKSSLLAAAENAVQKDHKKQSPAYLLACIMRLSQQVSALEGGGVADDLEPEAAPALTQAQKDAAAVAAANAKVKADQAIADAAAAKAAADAAAAAPAPVAAAPAAPSSPASPAATAAPAPAPVVPDPLS